MVPLTKPQVASILSEHQRQAKLILFSATSKIKLQMQHRQMFLHASLLQWRSAQINFQTPESMIYSQKHCKGLDIWAYGIFWHPANLKDCSLTWTGNIQKWLSTARGNLHSWACDIKIFRLLHASLQDICKDSISIVHLGALHFATCQSILLDLGQSLQDNKDWSTIFRQHTEV